MKANAGLFYANREEFVETLSLLARNTRLREALGENGRNYVRQHYRWEHVLGRFERLVATRSIALSIWSNTHELHTTAIGCGQRSPLLLTLALVAVRSGVTAQSLATVARPQAAAQARPARGDSSGRWSATASRSGSSARCTC